MTTLDYSQSGEQELVLKIADTLGGGKFLDIGAGDGVKFSNTKVLAERGWIGVMVEPSAQLFDRLVDEYRGSVVQLVQAVVTDVHVGPTPFFYTPGDLLSTTQIGHLGTWQGVPYDTVWAATVPLYELLDMFGPFNIVSIDTEGTSLELLAAYRTHKYWRDLAGIVVEVESVDDIARALSIAGDGWKVLGDTPNNLVLEWRS